MSILTKIFKTESQKVLIKNEPVLKKVLSYEEEYSKLSDNDLKSKTVQFKERLSAGETLDDLLPEAFATVREAAWRVLQMKPFPVQVTGGIVLHQGRIAEMKTGEGKTLVETMPIYLNALEGKGVFVITVNDYLAKRDAEWMGKIFSFLGLSTGLIINSTSPKNRKEQYECDILYSTNNEIGFDYLRDNTVYNKEEKVQRGLNYAVIDEIDSILIDEARTPLIISGMGNDTSENFIKADRFAKTLKGKFIDKEEGRTSSGVDAIVDKLTEVSASQDDSQNTDELNYDFIVVEKDKKISLTARGVEAAEKFYKIDSLADMENTEINYFILRALRANYVLKKEIDYIIENGNVVIVDEHTGRLMHGRRYSDGLHQAVEAKEKLKVQQDGKILATITLQNLFRKFDKLCGMTGTALTEQEEFLDIYNLDVIEIPTNKPIIREDEPDAVFMTKKEKIDTIIKLTKEAHAKGQPVLIGTASVESSEELSKLFKKNGLKHNVLNAKHHEKEAHIIAQAGKFGAITIATNMAGRGTDIILGGNPEYLALEEMKREKFTAELLEAATAFNLTSDKDILKARETFRIKSENYEKKLSEEANKVRQAGGLFVIGTERHASRRIDNQLRGRSGRQGDPGRTLFVLSLDDELIRQFIPENTISKVKLMASTIFKDENGNAIPLQLSILSNAIENAQKTEEGMFFDARKHLLKYDEVLNTQRNVIYEERNRALDKDNMGDDARYLMRTYLEEIIDANLQNPKKISLEDYENIKNDMDALKPYLEFPIYSEDELLDLSRDTLIDALYVLLDRKYTFLERHIKPENLNDYGKRIILFFTDMAWREQIVMMDELKEGIGLRAIGNQDPFIAYSKEGYALFESMLRYIREEVIKAYISVAKEREDKLLGIK